jgi:DNA-binding transcriptional MerR regulator
MHEFDSKDVQRLFGIAASQVRSLIRAGYIHPLKKAGRLSYSFQDLIVLRTLGALRAANIPTKKINRTLRQIRDSLPGELPLSGLSIVAVGDRIVVREGTSLRESDTGQYALALDVIDRGGDLVMIDPRAGASPPSELARPRARDRASAPEGTSPRHALSAQDQFEKALALEDIDVRAAQAAYEACLAADAHHTEARLNLGRLLHVGGRLREAEAVYRGAEDTEAIILYNLAVLLEDLERETEAMSAYREAIALDPALADAHFNLARLHERAGHPKDALRHLLAYRRLTSEQAT